jgi:hypothetical protein
MFILLLFCPQKYNKPNNSAKNERRKFKRKFLIQPDQSLSYLEYKVIDKDHNEIELKEERMCSSIINSILIK